MKVCTRCRLPKEISAFAIDRRKKDGRSIYCRECTRIYMHNRASGVLNPHSPVRISPLERFQSYISPVPECGCWLWAGAMIGDGYGTLKVGGKYILAHRYSWESTQGPIPDGIYVCHKCDVRLCVNPDHLFLGTQQDNIDDMIKKGRGRWPQISASQVESILATSGVTKQHLADLHGVSLSTINRVYRKAKES